MPRSRVNDLMMAADAILRTYADDKTIYYLDLEPLMTPVEDNFKGWGQTICIRMRRGTSFGRMRCCRC